MATHPFGLRENPFVAGNDNRFTYASREHQDALRLLRRAITDGEPFVLVTGNTGTGKTLLVSEALSDPQLNALAGFITHPALNRDELLDAIALVFAIPLPDGGSIPQKLAVLERQLREIRSGGLAAVLVLDEAHALDPALLEEVRLLSNLESDGHPLLQIVLTGLPDLERTLARPELAQLRQRIAVQHSVKPFSATETERYIHHRVSVAGGDAAALFPAETCFELHRYTYGFAREINRLAARALQRAERAGARAVSAEHVRAAQTEARLSKSSSAARVNLHDLVSEEGDELPSVPERDTADAGPPWAHRSAALHGSHGEETFPRPADEMAHAGAEGGAGHAAEHDVAAWVARFQGPDGPPKIGSRAGLPGDSPFGPEIADEPETDAEPPSASHRPMPPIPWLAAAGVVLLGLMLILLLSRHGTRSEAPPAAPALAQLPTPSPSPESKSKSAPPKTKKASAKSSAKPSGTEEAKAGAARPQTAKPETARSEAARSETPRGIDVGGFILEERAREECARLSSLSGHPCVVREVQDIYGSMYRVYLGPFSTQKEAEETVEALLSVGTVKQARVVRFPSRSRR